MKYLKKFEIKTTPKFEIGDYVILKDTYNIGMKDPLSIWHDYYGQIIDVDVTNSHFLVHMLSFIDDEMKDNDGDDEEVFGKKRTESDIWVCGDYLIKFDTKKEFDEAVNQIELEKDAKKYNL